LPYEGRYDAGYGTVLLGTGASGFNTLSPFQSGFMVNGEVRDIKKIKAGLYQTILAVARNNQSILFYKTK
jgi:hypothetical protein